MNDRMNDKTNDKTFITFMWAFAAMVTMLASLALASRRSDNAAIIDCIKAGNSPDLCASAIHNNLKVTFQQKPKS